MKNKKLKKALSVFLSVLMLMSCWVWVAPTDAEAAGSYYVRVYMNIYDGANSDGYGNAYSVVDDINSEFYGKPNEYKWDYGSSWNAFDNSDGYDGEVNMAGFTLFYDNDKKYKAYDLSADLVAATTTLGNNWTSMDDLTLENFAAWPNKVEKIYSFELDSMPSSLFWINDENNAVNGETSFGIHKITVAESSTSQEHILWTGLSGSESYYECYYGTITPTGIITPWDDCPGEATKTFYKDYTTSSVGTWIDPFNAGDYNVYPVNNYLSGGVSASFTVGNSGSSTDIDYIDVGNTNNYYINFTNHSTQKATITALNNSSLVSGFSTGLTLASGETKSFVLNKSSMGSGDGGYYNLAFVYTLDNVYESNGTTLVSFYQANGIGTWNTTDDSKAADTFQIANFGNLKLTFQADTGIFEKGTITNNNSAAVTFNHTYYLNTEGIDTWEKTGLRIQMTEDNYRRVNFQNPNQSPGNVIIGGDVGNQNSVSLRFADFVFGSVVDKAYTFNAGGGFAYYGTTYTPTWADKSSDSFATLYNNNTAWMRFTGTVVKGANSSNPAKITFNNMKFYDAAPSNATFSGTLNIYAFDKSDLRNYVRSLGGLGANWAPMRTRFNDTQWNAYESALETAVKVLANQKTNQKAVTDAYNALYSATEALKSTANLVNQVAEVTYTKRATDYDSAAVESTSKYLVMPIGTETAVPAYDTYKYTTSDNVVAKQTSNLKTNYTQYDTGINPIDYRYWKIDFTGVDEAVAEATSLLDSPLEAYSDAYYEKLFNARGGLTQFDRDSDTWTPTHQSDISEPLATLNALLAHNSTEAGAHQFVEEEKDNGLVYKIFFDDTTHWYECEVCGYKYMHDEHTLEVSKEGKTDDAHTVECTYVDSASGNTCDFVMTEAHTYTSTNLARPTIVNGEWENGTYTYTCECGATKTEEAARADYSKLTEAIEALEEIKNNENLSDEAKTAINNAIAKGEGVAQDLVTAEQDQIDSLVKELNDIKADADEAIKNKELGVEKITEATSGVKVQFIDASGLGVIDSVQLGKDTGFKIRVANGNADSNITIKDVNGTSVNKKLAPGESADFDITMPTTAGIKEYTITYTIDGLKNADGTAVEVTTKAYLYVKGEAYQPYHYLHEETAGIIFWQNAYMAIDYKLQANHGDFTVNNPTGAEQFNKGMKVEGANWVYTAYDFGEQCYNTTCTGDTDCEKKSDAHLATYNYFIDTSIAKTWEDAGFKASFAETSDSQYNYVNLKYLRLAVNDVYLAGVKEPKTFTVTFIPSNSGSAGQSMSFDSVADDETVEFYQEPYNDIYLFGEKSSGDTTQNIAYANFSGEIPTGINSDGKNPAKFMFAPKIRMLSGGGADEGSYMTTHIWLTSYDKAELRSAVAAAETAGYNSAYYDVKKYEAYETALKTAKEVLGKAETNQNEIDSAVKALENAIKALTGDENTPSAEAKFVLTITHSIHENADKNSTATSTQYDYYLVNGKVTPALKADVIALETINKYDAEVELNVTSDVEHTYNYWYIDYSGVQGAIDAAQNIIDNADKYDPDFVEDVAEAKTALQDILNGKDTKTTPESQDVVDNAIEAVITLTGHTCTDADTDHDCDTCGATMGTHADVDPKDHNCDYCNGKISDCTDVETDNDHNCDTCGKELSECTDTKTDNDHNCDICGKENITDHNYVDPVLARPTKNEDGTWNSGTYTSTCNCGDKSETTIARADYEAYDEAKADLNAILENDKLTQAAKDKITAALEANKIADDYIAIENEQKIVDNAATALNSVLVEINAGIDDGSALKPDYTAWEKAEEAYDKLDKTNVKEIIIDEANTLKAQIEKLQKNDKLTQATATQEDINEATARLNAIIAGINDGSLKNPADFTEVNKDLADAKDKADKNDVVDGVKEDIKEIEEELEKLEGANADKQGKIDALEDQLEEIIAGINDGSLVKPDYTEYNKAVNAYDSLKDKMSADDKAAVEAIKAEIAKIPADGTKAQYQAQIDKAAADIAAINAKYGDCAEGNHSYESVITEPTCTTGGYTTHTCTVCGHSYKNAETPANGHTWNKATESFETDTSVDGKVGYYSYDCSVKECNGELKIYVEAADYSELNNLVEALEKIITDNPDFTDAAKKEIQDAIDKAEAIPDNLTKSATEEGVTTPDGQKTIDDLVAELKKVVADTNNGIADGSALKPDYTAWEDAEDAYDDLDKTNVKADIVAEATALKAEIAGKQADETLTQKTATQERINDATARLNEIIAGINDGTLKKPADFTAVNEDLATAKDKADKNDVVDGVKEDIKEIEEKLEKLEGANADKQGEIDALEDQLEEIIKGINDGSLVKPDFDGYDASHDTYEELVKQYGDKIKDGVEKDVADLDIIVDGIREDETATKADDQDEVDNAKAALDAIIAGINDGSLRDPDYKDVEDKLAEVNKAEDLNKDTQDKIDAIEKELQAIKDKKDPEANAKDDQPKVDALEERLDEIIKDIADGTATAPDYTEWDVAEDTYDKLDKTNVKDEILTEVSGLKNTINTLKGDSTANAVEDQKTIDDATNRLNEIINGINDGSLLNPDDGECKHTSTEYVVDNSNGDKLSTHSLKCTACEEILSTGACTFTTNTVDSTCRAEGYTTYCCTLCGYGFMADFTEMTAHNYGDWATEKGSCVKVMTKTRYCLNKDCYAQETVEVYENGKPVYGTHTLVIVNGQAATCLKDGHSDYTRCIVCNEVTESEVIPAIGHIDSNNNGNCDVCSGLMNPIGHCSCMCHGDTFFEKLLFRLVNFFWKLFKINANCECGAKHW